MGGDEFMLILSEIAEERDAVTVAVKVLEALQKPFELRGNEIHITTSVGIAVHPDDGEDGDALMRNADIAMYRAKDRGRDEYHCFSSVSSEE
jgi:diguanylate cyclase (GGDEF)-like protein